MPGALSGIRIVDLTNVILGPYGTMLLADQGAEVIKVEAPEGDAVRHIGKPAQDAGHGSDLPLRQSQQALALPRPQEPGRARRPARRSSRRPTPSSMRCGRRPSKGLGLGYEEIRKIKPDIVYVGAYGFSADGPYGKLPAYDDAIQARFGIADLMGRAAGDDVPRYPPTILADKTCGLTFAFSTLSALMHRQRTGEGQFVEVPMFETMTAWLMVEHLWERTFDDEGAGRLQPPARPTRKPFRTLDGWMAILPYNDKHWRNFFEIVGRPEVLRGPALRDPQRPLAAHQRHVRHGRGAGARARPRPNGSPCSTRRRSPTRRCRARPICSTTRTWSGASSSRNTRIPARARCMMVEPPMRMSRTPPEIRTDGAADGRRFTRCARRGRRAPTRDRGAEASRRADRTV